VLPISSSPPTDVVVVVVSLPVVEADTGLIVVDAKIIANIKIVAAIAKYALYDRDVFLLLLFFSVFILRASCKEDKG